MCSSHNKINLKKKIKKPNTKDYTLRDSIYRKHTEKHTIYRFREQTVVAWGSGRRKDRL